MDGTPKFPTLSYDKYVDTTEVCQHSPSPRRQIKERCLMQQTQLVISDLVFHIQLVKMRKLQEIDGVETNYIAGNYKINIYARNRF